MAIEWSSSSATTRRRAGGGHPGLGSVRAPGRSALWPEPRVIGLQVTNEVNFYPIAPDASDSAFARARDALIQGVEAAHRTARRRGYSQLRIGFNWAYRTGPANEASFWDYLRDKGGRRFARAVDWVGLDAYPGTVFPPVPAPIGTGYYDAMSRRAR